MLKKIFFVSGEIKELKKKKKEIDALNGNIQKDICRPGELVGTFLTDFLQNTVKITVVGRLNYILVIVSGALDVCVWGGGQCRPLNFTMSHVLVANKCLCPCRFSGSIPMLVLHTARFYQQFLTI